MDKKTITIVAIGAALFFLLSFKQSGVKKKKKKLKPVIIPKPLQNITEREFYGTKAEFKAGQVPDINSLVSASAEGLIRATNMSADINRLAIANELKTAMQPGCC